MKYLTICRGILNVIFVIFGSVEISGNKGLYLPEEGELQLRYLNLEKGNNVSIESIFALTE